MTTQDIIRLTADYFKTQPVLKAWLFGSYSRGEQHEGSDVDILILPDKSQHFSLFTLSGMYEDLYGITVANPNDKDERNSLILATFGID